MKRAAPYNRDDALNAAMSLFWLRGYHATSLKDLEETLNMKPGSIYAAFSSKENLYLLTLERYFDAIRGQFRERMAQASSPLGGLAEFIRSFGQLSPNDAARQACMLTKTLVDTRNTEPAIAKKTRTYLARMRKEFAVVFEMAKAVGELPPNADSNHLARRFQANISALRFELHLGTGQKEISNLAEDMAREIACLRK
jgi:AcrR family transcriptional regulator